MGILTDDMKRVITEQQVGYVASVCADGTPNLSPKATMRVLDDTHIIFGDLRSPNTVENLQHSPVLELNFVDVFARKGYRFKGVGRYLEKGADAFNALLPHFEKWGDLSSHFRGIVSVEVERALPVVSPAYDFGATEPAFRAQWLEYFTDLNRA